MAKRGLFVGIDNFKNFSALSGCAEDARSMSEVLARHAPPDSSPNFEVRLVTDENGESIRRGTLRRRLRELFTSSLGDDLLFYYAGHGEKTSWGTELATSDGRPGEEVGISMNDIVTLANSSRARSVTIILDCCLAGAAGNAPAPDDTFDLTTLRENVVVMAAARDDQAATERNGRGDFTRLLLEGLEGAAADIVGRVNPLSLFSYASSGLGGWGGQDPVFKGHLTYLGSLRRGASRIAANELRRLPDYFPQPEACIQLSPDFDHLRAGIEYPLTRGNRIYDFLIALRDARLLEVEDDLDLYWALHRSKRVWLNTVGRYYWRLARRDRI